MQNYDYDMSDAYEIDYVCADKYQLVKKYHDQYEESFGNVRESFQELLNELCKKYEPLDMAIVARNLYKICSEIGVDMDIPTIDRAEWFKHNYSL